MEAECDRLDRRKNGELKVNETLRTRLRVSLPVKLGELADVQVGHSADRAGANAVRERAVSALPKIGAFRRIPRPAHSSGNL